MCGIFAVSGVSDKAGAIVLEGLKKLEYRGYDSWGIAVRAKDSGKLLVDKDVGRIGTVNCKFKAGIEAVGHTRWATHGGVTKANAHPHRFGKVTLVHNGIFENYASVKKSFEKKGETFSSETDTEVIACLLSNFLKDGLAPLEAIKESANIIKGRFSILVIIEGLDGIFAARRGSPLIIGRTETGTFIASDIPALLDHTNVVNYLDDDEVVFINGNTAQFHDLNTLEPLVKRDIKVAWKAEEASKGTYEHFMIKEIFDQKETIYQSINHSDLQLERAVELLKSTNGAYFIACGTAHKMAMAAEYYFADISGRKINVVPASEMTTFERFVHKKTAVIAVSQSGETADVLEILERSAKKGAKVLALTNVESSSMARMADVHLPLNAGPEKAVASTKAATSQLALLFLLAHADNGSINIGREILSGTASSINDLLNPRYEHYVRKVAEKLLNKNNLFIIGRKSLYPMALESAIKIQEVSYIHAQGFAAGELKHGPIALIEKGVPCLVLGDDQETLSNAIELKSRGAHIIGVAPETNEVFDDWLHAPDCDGAQAISAIIPVQILSYYLGKMKGINPDMPRNLAKSVTVK
ncbi:MAG TPA: glutamine--fructose-6-phosphate transaminase (isomerizing) [Candidatus Gracilibacteria bacterium]